MRPRAEHSHARAFEPGRSGPHTGKVDAAMHDGIGVESGEEALAVPDPVDDDGVDEAGNAHSVDQVRVQRAPLRDGA